MSFMLNPLTKCALMMLMSLVSFGLFSFAGFGIMALIIPFFLFSPSYKLNGPILRLSFQKNALGRYVCLRRFATFGLVVSLPIMCESLFIPSGALPRWCAVLTGGLLGRFALNASKKGDPSTGMAFGEAVWLWGFLLTLSGHVVIQSIGFFAFAFGIWTTFLALSRFLPYLDPLCALLTTKQTPSAAALVESFLGTCDILLGLILSYFLPKTQFLILSLILALLSALRFPLDKKNLDRLDEARNTRQKVLVKQLNPYILCKRKRRHFVWVIRSFIRLTVRGRLIGESNLPPENAQGVVYLCNHGYIYGTVFSRAWFPRPFRSWSISDLMEKEHAHSHIHTFIVDPQKWIPPFMRETVTRILIRAFAWLLDSLDSIPVYRNQLRKLMFTFRETADALICGDAVMIYPENPDDASLPEPGYQAHTIAPFFTGFTMINSLYYNETGLPVTYVPMYCSLKAHTLSIGTPIVHNPDNDPIFEKERIVLEARETMLSLMRELEGEPSSCVSI